MLGVGRVPHFCVTHLSEPVSHPPLPPISLRDHQPALPHSWGWGGKCPAEVKGGELGNTPEFSFHHPEIYSPTQVLALSPASVSPSVRCPSASPSPFPHSHLHPPFRGL